MPPSLPHVSGAEAIRALEKLGFKVARQKEGAISFFVAGLPDVWFPCIASSKLERFRASSSKLALR